MSLAMVLTSWSLKFLGDICRLDPGRQGTRGGDIRTQGAEQRMREASEMVPMVGL